jgi:hypothetical protein
MTNGRAPVRQFVFLTFFSLRSSHRIVTPAQAGAHPESVWFKRHRFRLKREMGPGLRRGDSWWMGKTTTLPAFSASGF